MTEAETLYLIGVIVAAAAFCAMLAYSHIAAGRPRRGG